MGIQRTLIPEKVFLKDLCSLKSSFETDLRFVEIVSDMLVFLAIVDHPKFWAHCLVEVALALSVP